MDFLGSRGGSNRASGIGAMAKGAEDWVREAREVKDAMREHSPAVSQWATEGKGESPSSPPAHSSTSLSLSLSLS